MLITAPNDVDRVDRILATLAVLERAVLSLGTDRSSACVATPTNRTFHYRDSRDNTDIRTGRRRRLFELLRRPLLVDN